MTTPVEGFAKAIEKVAKISEEEKALIVASLEYKEYQKHEVMTYEGAIENYVYYIVDGSIRNYLTIEGDDISLDFFFTGDFTNSYTSFLTRKPSLIAVEALTDLKVLRIHFNDLQKLYETSLNVNKIGRMITETLYIKRTKRELSLITKTARERYDELMQHHPEFIQNIPQKYLSTFLGVTPETLSRLRASK